MEKQKKKTIAFLATDEMITFLNKRAQVAGNRSEYIRHLILQDMYGIQSDYVIREERQQQLEDISDVEMGIQREMRDEIKSALAGGINGLLKSVPEEKENGNSD